MADDFDFADDPATGVSEVGAGENGAPPSTYLPPAEEDIDYTGVVSQGGPGLSASGSGTGVGLSTSAAASGYADLDALPSADPEEDDPLQAPSALDEFLAQWEVKLSEKRQYEAEKKAEAVDKAQQELGKFHEERELLREKKQSLNRKDEQVKVEKLVADLELENPWERVVNLVDMQVEAGSKVDLSRMKQIFIQLKNNPDPQSNPTASGSNNSSAKA